LELKNFLETRIARTACCASCVFVRTIETKGGGVEKGAWQRGAVSKVETLSPDYKRANDACLMRTEANGSPEQRRPTNRRGWGSWNRVC